MIPKANNNGADQSAPMRRLVCVFVVRKPSDSFYNFGLMGSAQIEHQNKSALIRSIQLIYTCHVFTKEFTCVQQCELKSQ